MFIALFVILMHVHIIRQSINGCSSMQVQLVGIDLCFLFLFFCFLMFQYLD